MKKKLSISSYPRFLTMKEEEMFNGITNPLVLLLRKICSEKGVDPYRWIEMADTYYRECLPDMPRHKISSDKTNLADGMSKGTISFDIFCKAMSILAYAEPDVAAVVFDVRFEKERKEGVDPLDDTIHSIKILQNMKKKNRSI